MSLNYIISNEFKKHQIKELLTYYLFIDIRVLSMKPTLSWCRGFSASRNKLAIPSSSVALAGRCNHAGQAFLEAKLKASKLEGNCNNGSSCHCSFVSLTCTSPRSPEFVYIITCYYAQYKGFKIRCLVRIPRLLLFR